MASIAHFLADDKGATAIEYGLIAAMIAIGCMVAFTAFGVSLTGLFGWVQERAGGAMDNATG
jgi:pilus assembly protein Flp/PilA